MHGAHDSLGTIFARFLKWRGGGGGGLLGSPGFTTIQSILSERYQNTCVYIIMTSLSILARAHKEEELNRQQLM